MSTLASSIPSAPYIFRSYELPMEAELQAAKIQACAGSSKHTIWQVSSPSMDACVGASYDLRGLLAKTKPVQ